MKAFMTFLFVGLSLTAEARVIKSSTDLFRTYEREIQGKTSQLVERESFRDYDNFIALDVNAPGNSGWADKDAHKQKYLSLENANKALARAMSNPVVSLDRYSKYDPDNRGIGFCFGRAMFINTYLAMAGFNRGSMKKAFIMGSMSKGAWAWHVTTIAQSKNKAGKEIWLALDPVIGRVMEVTDWYKYWQMSSDDGMLRLYISDAGKFAPSAGGYDEISISNRFYNNYFRDMMNWFGQNDVSKDLRF